MVTSRRPGMSQVTYVIVFLTLAILAAVVGASVLGFMKVSLIDVIGQLGVDQLLTGLGGGG